MMKKFIYTICFLFFVCISYGQNKEFTKIAFPDNTKELRAAQSNIKKGKKAFEKYADYREAMKYFLKANDFNPKNAELNYKIFLCYYELYMPENGFSYLEQAIMLDSNYHPDMLFYRGVMNQYYYKFDTAIYYFTIAKTMKNKAIKHINECHTGKLMLENEVRCFIDNVGENVNSEEDEYNPIITADGTTLYFTSRREGKNIDYAPDGKYYENIYVSELNPNKQWDKAEFVKELNSETHDAVQGLSHDGLKIVIYRNDNNGDLYESKKRNNKFQNPKPIPGINRTESHETSAAYSFDVKTIYFCSDRQGGYGKHDIYKATLNKKGKFDKIENLGSVINTEEEERCVFAHPDGKTIYFSSQGHDGMGGYDIYYSTFENNQWSKPVNVGYPINTPGDDIYFVITADGKIGYYASNQSGGMGGKDIYLITLLGPEKLFVYNTEDNLLAESVKPFTESKSIKTLDIEPPKLTLLKGTVVDEETKTPIFADIDLYNLENNELLASFESNDITGKFLLSLPSGKNYSVNVKAQDYLFHSQNFNLPDSAGYQEIEQIIELKKIEIGKEIVLNNIFFEFNKATLLKESINELENVYKLLVDNPNISVEISGHTDNVGSATYNNKLSLERANSVVKYLIDKGIATERLSAVGYGFDKPIAPNTSEEGRQKNRRTEFKILEK
jgi:outer membrane protein OmpA-like peptidoglycan-associated protein/Tol biopolymer transport system component